MPSKPQSQGRGMRTRFEIPGVQGLVVFQRQDAGDNWYARIPIRVPGERRYKVMVLRDENGQTTTSQDVAIQLAMLEYGRVLAKKKDGTVSTLWDVSFGRVLDEYLEHLRADPKSKPSTPRRAHFAAKPLRQFFDERTPILNVAKRLDEYPAWRLRQPVRAGKPPRASKRPSMAASAGRAEPKLVAPTTVQHEMNVLIACLTWAAKKKGYLRLEDIQDYRFGVDDEEKGTRSALERSEWETIRDWCWEWAQSNNNAYTRRRRMMFYWYCIFLVHSGMRVGEVHQLRWRDIVITHVEDAAEVRAEITIMVNKSKQKRKRDHIPMPEIEDAIVELQVQRSEFPGDNDFQKPNDYVFCNEDGTPIYNNAWGDLWRDMLNALYETRGIDLRTDRDGRAITRYCLRHSYMTWRRIEGGASYDDLAENTGTSAAMLRKTYIKTNNQANRAKLTYVRPEHLAERDAAYQQRYGVPRPSDRDEENALADEDDLNALG